MRAKAGDERAAGDQQQKQQDKRLKTKQEGKVEAADADGRDIVQHSNSVSQTEDNQCDDDEGTESSKQFQASGPDADDKIKNGSNGESNSLFRRVKEHRGRAD